LAPDEDDRRVGAHEARLAGWPADHYTLQAPEAEYELVPILIDQGLGIPIWSPLAGGLLSGKYRRGHKPPD